MIQGRRHMEPGMVQRQDTALQVSWLPTLKLWIISQLVIQCTAGRIGSNCEEWYSQLRDLKLDRNTNVISIDRWRNAGNVKAGVVFC